MNVKSAEIKTCQINLVKRERSEASLQFNFSKIEWSEASLQFYLVKIELRFVLLASPRVPNIAKSATLRFGPTEILQNCQNWKRKRWSQQNQIEFDFTNFQPGAKFPLHRVAFPVKNLTVHVFELSSRIMLHGVDRNSPIMLDALSAVLSRADQHGFANGFSPSDFRKMSITFSWKKQKSKTCI